MSDLYAAEGFTWRSPTEEGWYEAVLRYGSEPELVYVWVGERGISMGRHPGDKPLAIDDGMAMILGLRFRRPVNLSARVAALESQVAELKKGGR